MYRALTAVGVGSGVGWQALTWAVAEAQSSGGRLVVHHVCQAGSVLATASGASWNGAVPFGTLELADPPLARALAAARTTLGGPRVGLSIHTGSVTPALVAASADADLLVLGAAEQGRYSRIAHEVTASAHCPVAVIRPPAPPADGPFAGHVVVGVDGPGTSQAALDFGFHFAAAHRRALAAVYVGEPEQADAWVDGHLPRAGATAEPPELSMLSVAVEPWTHKYPTVAVKRGLLAGPALSGLLRAGTGARLMVVGARGHASTVRDWLGAAGQLILGPVSRGVVDRATCPVAVAPTEGR